MIIEGIVTTVDQKDVVNIAPMGPIVDSSFSELVLRPFQTSTTYQNLKSSPYGVFHVVDDVLLIVNAALDRLETIPSTFAAKNIAGRVLADCCRWYEFEVFQFDDSQPRTELKAKVVHSDRIRDHFGFNRAKHAVIEATILATRLHLLDEQEVRKQIQFFSIPVEKTAGTQEKAAFQRVEEYIDSWYRDKNFRRFTDE